MPVKYVYSFKDSKGDTLTSATEYATQADADNAVLSFLTSVLEETNYAVKKSGTVWRVNVTDDSGNVLAVSNDFAKKSLANQAVNLFIAEFNKECDSLGLHLIEHILLRPRDDKFLLAPVCLDPNCDFCGEQDPYSFRISVVLPYWPVHFRNLAFRSYFEELVRREAPAHTTVKVCWINNSSMYDFDKAYKDWITVLANYEFDTSTINALQAANDKLINLLFNLHSEYPVATLHDCVESKDTNPVMLGKTILGSFKK